MATDAIPGPACHPSLPAFAGHHPWPLLVREPSAGCFAERWSGYETHVTQSKRQTSREGGTQNHGTLRVSRVAEIAMTGCYLKTPFPRSEEGTAVHEIQELQFELQAPQCRRHASPSRLTLGIAFVAGTFAAFFAALVLGAVFAHPAGAAVLPGSPAGDPGGLVSNVTQPLGSPVAAAHATDLGTITPIASPVAAALTPALSPVVTKVAPIASPAIAPLSPVVQPVLVAVAPLVGPVVTALNPVLAPTWHVTSPLLSSVGSALSAGPNRRADVSSGPVADASGAHVASSAPAPLPRPVTPIPPFPAATTASSTDGSASPSGSSSPAAHPPSGLLLPDPMVTGLTLGRSKSPALLFDLRHSPPG
jgi:hypothetical protein